MSFGGGFNNSWPNSAPNANMALASSLIAAALNLNTVGSQQQQQNFTMNQMSNFENQGGGKQFQNDFSGGGRRTASEGRGGIIAPWAKQSSVTGPSQQQQPQDGQNYPQNSFAPHNRQQQRFTGTPQNRGGFVGRGAHRGNHLQGFGHLMGAHQKAEVAKIQPKKTNFKKATTPQSQTVEAKDSASNVVDSSDSKVDVVETASKSAYDGLPKGLLTCQACDKEMWDGMSFERHLNGRVHQEMMAHLEEENMMYVALLRHHARLVETQRLTKIKTPAGKRNDVQSSHCQMCDVPVMGSLLLHRKNPAHLQLKRFLHPICLICSHKEFHYRSEWDVHRFSADHLHNLFKKNIDKLGVEPSYFTLFTEGTGKKNIIKTETEKSSLIEAKELAESQVLDYKIPTFEESKAVGLSFLRKVEGHWCTMCKKFLLDNQNLQEHCVSEPHYEKFVEIVKQKKAQAETNGPAKKRKLDDSVADNNDDNNSDDDAKEIDYSGNWKRKKTSNHSDSEEDEEDLDRYENME